jgi:hypothetical protein
MGKVVKGTLLALLVTGVILNFGDIKRYVKMTMM